jgi:hypothetical protein
MILKSLYLHIGVLGLPADYTYSFKKRSRFICNWLEREVLKPLKQQCNGFHRIVVMLCSAPNPSVYVNTSKVACVEIPFDRHRIDASTGIAFTELQIAMLKSGIEKCADTATIPKSELLRGLEVFVEQGMKNEWLHKKRTFKQQNLTAALSCKMTQEVFSLRLSVLHHKTTVFDGVILETETDEIVFNHKFKDITIDNDNLVVTARIGPPLWTKPLVELVAAP